MRFLALTGPQALLLALATAGVLIAFYFLKLRHRRVVVASSMLWSRVLDERQAHSLWERLRKLISIVLAVAIGLLIALAIGRPELPWLSGPSARTLLVLDTSPTMLARTGDGSTRWQRARDAALAVIDSSPPSAAFRLADTSGRVDSGFTSDRHELRSVINRMRPTVAAAQFPDLDVASGTEGDAFNIRFITDGVIPVTLPAGVSTISVFQPAENVGITAFDIRTTPSSPLAYEAYLEIHNYGRQTRRASITISGAGRQRLTREVELNAGGGFQEPFDLSQFEGGGIRATVQADGDGFALDDTAYTYLPVKRRTRTLLASRGNNYLETLLKLHSLVDLTVVDPSAYRPDSAFDVHILDGFIPASPPSRPVLVVGAPEGADWVGASTGRIRNPKFASWNEDHPAMQFVSLHDVSIDRATRIDGQNAAVLAEAENGAPLILASQPAKRPRWVVMTFGLQETDFPLHTGFPVFIDNVLGWFGREPLALRRQPGLVEVPMAAAEIKALDGTAVPAHPGGTGTFFETDEPGLYLAAQGDSRQYVAVNLASREYSNINKTTPGTASSTGRAGWLRQELWFYMLFAALALMAAEWFTYHRRITL